MRDELRNRIKLFNGKKVYLQATYQSMDNALFDVENILFYNVRTSAFAHLDISNLQFERVYKNPPQSSPNNYLHYQSYKLLEEENVQSRHWKKATTLAKWRGIHLPFIKSDTKPHSIWHSFRTGNMEVLKKTQHPYYGLELTINISPTTQIVSILKPLLDGVISSFHHHDQSQLTEVVSRLRKQLPLEENELLPLLLDEQNSVLGERNLVQPYRDFVKWNPADDAFTFIKVNVNKNRNNTWTIDGELFAVEKIQ